MTHVQFTHANNKVPVYVTREHVWNVYFSDAQKSTFIVSHAGAIIPVVESVTAVIEKVYGTSPIGGTNHGSETSK